MTYSLNDIINYDVFITDEVVLFDKPIRPLMNITATEASSTITYPSTTIVSPRTTVAVGSDGFTLPQSTINVADTSSFPASGSFTISDSNGDETISYTGTTGTSFTGCSGGIGTLTFGDLIFILLPQSTITVVSTAGFPSSGTISISNESTVTYTGTTATTFTGCSGGDIVLNTGDLVYIPVPSSGTFTIDVVSTTNFTPTGGAVIITADFGEITFSYTGITSTSFTGCTIEFGGGVSLESNSVISQNVSAFWFVFPRLPFTAAIRNTTGSGLNPLLAFAFGNSASISATPTTTVTTSTTTLTGATTTVDPASNGQTLTGSGDTITVLDATGFPSSGQFVINSDQVILYTGTTSTTFTGCSGGGGLTLSTGNPIVEAFVLPQSTINVVDTSSFPSSGSIIFADNFSSGLVSYTGTTGTSFTGCNGGDLTIFASETVVEALTLPQSTINVASTTGFPVSGSMFITDTNETEEIAYTGTTGTSFTGCSGGTGIFVDGNAIIQYNMFNTIVTGASEIPSFANFTQSAFVGNTGSNNDGSQTPAYYISSTSFGYNAFGTFPDANDGSIIWALSDYQYDSTINISNSGKPDFGNRVDYFISDGYNIRLTQRLPQTWGLESVGMNDGFNSNVGIFGNLIAVKLTTNSLSAPFSLGIQQDPFSSIIDNTTAFPVTFGYTTDDVTFTGSTVTIAAGQSTFVFGDAVNVFSAANSSSVAGTLTIPVFNNNNGSTIIYTISSDPSGTTYLVDNSLFTQINLPFAPANGTQYTFKDDTWSFFDAQPFTINPATGFSGNGQDYISQSPGLTGLVTSASYTNPNLSFTLEYSQVTSGDTSSLSDSVAINSGNSPYTIIESSGQTYIANATGSTITAILPEAPSNDTMYTFKDFGDTWSDSFVFQVATQGSDLFLPSNSTEQTFSTPGGSFTYQYFNGFWSLVGVWRVISANKNEIGVTYINNGNTIGGEFFPADSRIIDYFIDTSAGAITCELDSAMIPYDGQIVSFKDISGTWNIADFSITLASGVIESPGGGNFQSSVSFTTPYNYVKYMYSAEEEAWFLISQLLTD